MDFCMAFEKYLKICIDSGDSEIIEKLINHTVPGGKMLRTKFSYKMCEQLDINPEFSFYNEMFQAAALLFDDFADKDKIRRGKKCWYLDRGPNSLRDGYFLLSLVQKKLNINNQQAIDVIYDTLLDTMIGQMIEVIDDEPNPSTYDDIAFFKTSLYTFYMPLAVPLVIKGEELGSLKLFSEKCGIYLQMVNDIGAIKKPHTLQASWWFYNLGYQIFKPDFKFDDKILKKLLIKLDDIEEEIKNIIAKEKYKDVFSFVLNCLIEDKKNVLKMHYEQVE